MNPLLCYYRPSLSISVDMKSRVHGTGEEVPRKALDGENPSPLVAHLPTPLYSTEPRESRLNIGRTRRPPTAIHNLSPLPVVRPLCVAVSIPNQSQRQSLIFGSSVWIGGTVFLPTGD